ncbi:MAG: serine hydrolase domain-containing protein [Gemmatimonadota bacterium]|nr:serine hydrolase domain-containing protein [Gemmatimonadota bacterium]
MALLVTATLLAPPSAAPLSAQETDDSPTVTAADAARADEYLTRLEAFGLAGGVLVAKDGRVLLAKGYGLADRGDAEGPPRPWTAATVSTVGSITKQFTAAGIMKLAEEGALSVTDSLGRFFDGVPAEKRAITLHHLLTHTAGFGGVAEGDFDFLSREEIVEKALASELLSEPGEEYRYSNLGYSLLGAVVEVVTGEEYEAWMRENLFRPAGMYETGYVLPGYEPARVATGYRGEERWGTVVERIEADRGPSWVLRANGGVHTTLHDMHRWVRALGVLESDDDTAEARPALLTRESRERMFTPHADEGGGTFYGYGWVVAETPWAGPVLAHDGGNGILFSNLILFPDHGLETFMMTSASDFRATWLLRRIDRILFGEEVPMPPAVETTRVAPATLERLAGRYRLEGGGELEVVSRGSALAIHVVGQPAVDRVWTGEPVGSVPYAELNRRAERFARAFGAGDYSTMRSMMGPDTPAEPFRSYRERLLARYGPIEEVEALGTVPAWFHGGSSEVTWLRIRFERDSRIRRIHWLEDGTVEGVGGEVYPAPLTLRCAMTAPDACTGWHEGLETGEPTVSFSPGSLTIRTPAGEVRARPMEAGGG